MKTVANMRTPGGGFLVEMTATEHSSVLFIAKQLYPDCILKGKRVPLCERDSAHDVDEPDLLNGDMPKLAEALLYMGYGISSIKDAILSLQAVQKVITQVPLRAQARS